MRDKCPGLHLILGEKEPKKQRVLDGRTTQGKKRLGTVTENEMRIKRTLNNTGKRNRLVGRFGEHTTGKRRVQRESMFEKKIQNKRNYGPQKISDEDHEKKKTCLNPSKLMKGGVRKEKKGHK